MQKKGRIPWKEEAISRFFSFNPYVMSGYFS